MPQSSLFARGTCTEKSADNTSEKRLSVRCFRTADQPQCVQEACFDLQQQRRAVDFCCISAESRDRPSSRWPVASETIARLAISAEPFPVQQASYIEGLDPLLVNVNMKQTQSPCRQEFPTAKTVSATHLAANRHRILNLVTRIANQRKEVRLYRVPRVLQFIGCVQTLLISGLESSLFVTALFD